VTVVTLVTVDCRLFLDRRRPLYFVDSLTPSIYPYNPDARSGKLFYVGLALDEK
jgi:hypothetical protein